MKPPVSKIRELVPPPGRFDDEDDLRPANDATSRPPPYVPPLVSSLFAAALERVERRCSGREKPIALPWPVLADHFGGGLWPGLHVINAGTGVGKTQLALQVGVHAAKCDVPTLYVGLELAELDLSLRVLGEEANVPWSQLWTGKAGPTYVDRARQAIPRLAEMPFRYEVSRPHGFAPSALRDAVDGMRAAFPEEDGPGSRPMLVIVDFLQLLGDEEGEDLDLRARVGRASYVLRDLASRIGAAVLCISSVARERYRTLADLQKEAGLAYDLDEDECPIKRRITNTDAIVGTGKESGDIEYSADSVSVMARVGETWDGTGCDIVFATGKGRATGATWSPLHFTGFGYRECSDRGGRVVEAWKEATEKRAAAREEKQAAKLQAKDDAVQRDADAVRAYVASHPGCSVNDAKSGAVEGQHRRWVAARERLGSVLVQTKVGAQKLELSIAEEAQP